VSLVRRNPTEEELASQSIPVLLDTNKMVLFAIQTASLATTESVQSAGNLVLPVGLMKVHSAELMSISMEKDAVAQSSDAVVAAKLATPMMVAHAEETPKSWLKAAMVVELELHWVAQATKTSMVDSATRNAKLVTLELAQSAGKTVLETLSMLALLAPRNHMAELLVSP
jgi:hypothetical protein